MKRCPTCGHFEVNEAKQCSSCGSGISRATRIEPVDDIRTVCSSCRVLHAGGESICSRCGGALAEFSPHGPPDAREYDWMYALTLFMPYAGILMAAVLCASPDERKSSAGRPLVFFAFVLTVVYFCLIALFALLLRT